jgi:hypothetical protein
MVQAQGKFRHLCFMIAEHKILLAFLLYALYQENDAVILQVGVRKVSDHSLLRL